MKDEATPRPWKVGARASIWREPFMDSSGNRVHQPIADCDTPALLSDEEKRANAALIVHAVNSYPALVKALEEAADHFEEIANKALHWQNVFAKNDEAASRWRQIQLHADKRASVLRTALSHTGVSNG